MHMTLGHFFLSFRYQDLIFIFKSIIKQLNPLNISKTTKNQQILILIMHIFLSPLIYKVNCHVLRLFHSYQC